MNCPNCGAWSSVLDTRAGPHESLRRRRECANGHRFVTLEVLPTVIHHDAREATARAIAKRRALWRRDQSIRADTRMQKVIAAQYGLSRHQVGKIMKGVRR